MKKVSINKGLTRKKLANPFCNINMQDRLKKAGAINMTDNYKLTRLNSGYDKIEPVDSSKTF